MANITISMQDQLIKAGREYAKRYHMSLNGLIRKLIERTVTKPSSQSWLDECFCLMDKAKIQAHPKRWKREDLYRV